MADNTPNDPNTTDLRAKLYEALGVETARSVIDGFGYALYVGRTEGLRVGLVIGIIIGALGTFVLYLVSR
jgi:hypothetical protein